jgi:hypothetical protein|tara:strand:- start:195 stop:1025 length:831 start_codon:yes stop_codon:yes gene_type:complete
MIEYYGDNHRWFLGIVESNKDPLKLGRLQVRIRGIHSRNLTDIPLSALPWAQVVIPSTEGGISGIGKMAKIQNGAQVYGIFMDGEHSQLPLVIGSIHTTEKIETEGNKSTDESYSLIEHPSGSTVAYEGTGNVELLGSANGEKAYNFYLANQFTPNQSAGIVGNFAAESNIEPDILNPNDLGKPAFGLAQWRGDRRAGLKNFSTANDMNYRTMEAQLLWSMHEFRNKEKRAFSKIKASNSLRESTHAVEKYYERPQPGTFGKRFSFAQQILERYSQ